MTDLDTMSEMWDLAASTHERPKTELDRAYDTLRAGWKTLPAFRHEFAQSLLRASFPSEKQRHWIITAYIARKLAEGVVEWKKS